MKVGDYVRTKHYGISKITDIYNEDKIELDKVNAFGIRGVCYMVENIIKSSPKIINLIQAEDYVNGRKVYQVGYNFQDDLVLKMSINADGTPNNFEDFIYEKDIKSIVTKEMYSSVEYRVENN